MHNVLLSNSAINSKYLAHSCIQRSHSTFDMYWGVRQQTMEHCLTPNQCVIGLGECVRVCAVRVCSTMKDKTICTAWMKSHRICGIICESAMPVFTVRIRQSSKASHSMTPSRAKSFVDICIQNVNFSIHTWPRVRSNDLSIASQYSHNTIRSTPSTFIRHNNTIGVADFRLFAPKLNATLDGDGD